MILYKKDVTILELLKQSKSPKEIRTQLKISESCLNEHLRNLRDKKIIERTEPGKYEILIEQYEVTKDPKPKTAVGKRKKSNIPPDQAALIKRWYRKVPRSQLAKTVGVGKVQLNMMLIELGLGS